MNKISPENPSLRKSPIILQFRCNVCEKVFKQKDNFIKHLEKTMHRICYKCGYKVGTTINWMEGKFVAKRIISNENIATWKYVHKECPICEPSTRGKYYQKRAGYSNAFLCNLVNHVESVV